MTLGIVDHGKEFCLYSKSSGKFFSGSGVEPEKVTSGLCFQNTGSISV